MFKASNFQIIIAHRSTIKAATRRTSRKLVANPGWQPGFPTSSQLVMFATVLGCQQVGNLIDLSRNAGLQLAAQVECRKRPGLQQVAN